MDFYVWKSKEHVFDLSSKRHLNYYMFFAKFAPLKLLKSLYPHFEYKRIESEYINEIPSCSRRRVR